MSGKKRVSDRTRGVPLGWLLGLLFLISPARGSDTTAEAIAYLQSLSPQLKIYVWPTKLRPYEIVGQDPSLSGLIQVYRQGHEGLFQMTASFGTPVISIYSYSSSTEDYQADFFSKSGLPLAYKKGIGGLLVFDKACAYDAIRSRGTWASGGFVFVDTARLQEQTAQAECLSAGLDFIHGFPIETFDYKRFPAPSVRQAILEAIAECSAEGRPGVVDEERTRDGLTPLPSIECAIEKLGD